MLLDIRAIKSEPDMRILFAHLIPMLASIRGIECNHIGFEILAAEYPGKLELAKELDLYTAKKAFIPAYMNWLIAPQPRFMKISACANAIFAIVDAVHQV